MKKTPLYIFALLISSLACDKIDYQELGSFDVALNSPTVQVGEEVVFALSGEPDNIAFYSGELGKEYSLRDQQYAEGAIPEMQFATNVNFGSPSVSNLSILLSTDFSGKYDADGVRKATWEDITEQARLASGSSNTNSGWIGLHPFKTEGKPIYVAFRYLTQPHGSAFSQREWQMNGFQFRARFPNGKQYDHASSNADAGFGNVSLKGDSVVWTGGATQLRHRPSDIAEHFPEVDNWAISRAFNINQVSPDRLGAVNVKGILMNTPHEFRYRFDSPGIYEVVFEATSFKYDGVTKVVTKKFNIEIKPLP